jgi:ELWxxDGT repeat protein
VDGTDGYATSPTPRKPSCACCPSTTISSPPARRGTARAVAERWHRRDDPAGDLLDSIGYLGAWLRVRRTCTSPGTTSQISDGLADGTAPVTVDQIWQSRRLRRRHLQRAARARRLEPWVSDGTAAGRASGRHQPRQPGLDRQHSPISAARWVADDTAHGRELWRSDGTAASTRLVRHRRRREGSFPADLTVPATRSTAAPASATIARSGAATAPDPEPFASADRRTRSRSAPTSAAASTSLPTNPPRARCGTATARPPAPSSSAPGPSMFSPMVRSRRWRGRRRDLHHAERGLRLRGGAATAPRPARPAGHVRCGWAAISRASAMPSSSSPGRTATRALAHRRHRRRYGRSRGRWRPTSATIDQDSIFNDEPLTVTACGGATDSDGRSPCRPPPTPVPSRSPPSARGVHHHVPSASSRARRAWLRRPGRDRL